jgi:predicted nucleic acid-binding protein
MKITVAVDANIILSALLGGKPSSILFDSRFQFITSEFTLNEIKKYLPKLEKKLDISQQEIASLLNQLPLEIYERAFYKTKLEEAEEMIARIDEKDVDILALALKFEAYLWSEDKDFEKAGYKKLLKTYSFIS